MMKRHWQQVSDKVGFEVNPQADNFTFTTILDLGLLQHTDTCVEVGERANKEF